MQKKKLSLKRLIFSAIVLLTIFPNVGFATDFPDIPKGWSDGYVYANGIRIHYYHAVPAPGKQAIIAIHGGTDTGLAWASLANELQDDYDIYMLDTRGHGLSDPLNGSEDNNTLPKDIMAVAEKLGLENPIIMGHSMGGRTVIQLGAQYPDFARAIIVVDAGIRPPRPENENTSDNQSPPPSSDPLAIARRGTGTPEILVKQNNYSFDALVAKAHRENPRWSMMDCEYWAVAIKRYHGNYSNEGRTATLSIRRDENALANIPLPMIILKADAPPETRKLHQEAAKIMQNGKLVHIDNSAHNLQRDQPERSAEVIRGFLSEVIPK